MRAGKKNYREVGPASGRSSLGGRARPEPNGIGHTRSPYVVPPSTTCPTRQLVRAVAGGIEAAGRRKPETWHKVSPAACRKCWRVTHGGRWSRTGGLFPANRRARRTTSWLRWVSRRGPDEPLPAGRWIQKKRDSANSPIHKPVTGGDELGPDRSRLSRVVRAGKKVYREVGPASGRSSLGGRARPEPNGIGHTRSPYVVPPSTTCPTRQLVRAVAGGIEAAGRRKPETWHKVSPAACRKCWRVTHGGRWSRTGGLFPANRRARRTTSWLRWVSRRGPNEPLPAGRWIQKGLDSAN